MSEIALSRLQFIVSGLVYNSTLFSLVDFAHLNHIEVTLTETKECRNALLAEVRVYFYNWSYTKHEESTDLADAMPAEVRVVFMQDKKRKLTGQVIYGFFGEEPKNTGYLPYLRGW